MGKVEFHSGQEKVVRISPGLKEGYIYIVLGVKAGNVPITFVPITSNFKV